MSNLEDKIDQQFDIMRNDLEGWLKDLILTRSKEAVNTV